MAGLFGGGGGAGAPPPPNRESLPQVLRDAPLWDRSKLTFEDWRTDTDYWRDIVEHAGMGASTVAGSIFFSIPEEEKPALRLIPTEERKRPETLLQKLDGSYKIDEEDQGEAFHFQHLGPRVPAIMCSAWLDHTVCSTPCEHATIPALLKSVFQLHSTKGGPEGYLSFRDHHANNPLVDLPSRKTLRTDALKELPRSTCRLCETTVRRYAGAAALISSRL